MELLIILKENVRRINNSNNYLIKVKIKFIL